MFKSCLWGAVVLAAFCASADSAVKVSSFGFDAEDATLVVQRALDSGAKTIVLDRQATSWKVRPLFVRSNTEIVFEEGVELTAKKGAFLAEFDSLITAQNVSNVIFRAIGKGASLTMRREDYNKPPYTFSEHRHIFNLLGTSNVMIENLRIAESGGDGIYVGRGRNGATCRNTVIRRCDCDRNHRQGVSVITANGLLIADTKLRNTIGTAPKAGIDFEPNSSDEELVDCVLDNCDITGNDGHGVDLYLGSFHNASKPVSITVRNSRIVGNSRFARFHAGHKSNPDDAVKGRVMFENCLFDAGGRREARFHVAKPGTGYLAVLKNCVIIEPEGAEHYAVFPCDTPYDQPLPDGFHFDNVTIRQPKARPWMRPGPKNWFERRPTDWRGTVTCVSPEGTRTETLDAAWCARTFPYPEGEPIGSLVKEDFSRMTVDDPSSGKMTACSSLGFRERADFVFYAAAHTARFKIRYERMKDYPNRQPKGEIVLREISGRPVRKLVDLDYAREDVALDIVLPKTGFWKLSAKISGLAKLTIVEADVPVALDCSEGAQQFIYSTGSASFFVPSGKKPEVIMSADPGEYVGVVVRDANGREVIRVPAFSNATERYVVQAPADADGFWTVDFVQPTRGNVRKYFFHVRNVPGYLFLSPNRRWRAGDSRVSGSREYYADNVNGNDGNDGLSEARAFRTLARATKALKAGDVLNLAHGAVFHESLVLRSSGEPGHPIVIRGNNATVDGAHPLDSAKWKSKGNDLWFMPSDACWGALRPRVYLGENVLTDVYGNPNQVDPEKIEPMKALWRSEGVYFRAEPGKKPSDYALLGGTGRTRSEHSGVIINNRSYITVENLVSQRFPNDGYNVHGRCAGIVFRNIVARQNGDDGFSIHEDVTAVVEGLHSYGNDYGVEDVGTAQTVISGALIETNRLSGFSVYGGMRILRDAKIRGNGGRQLSVRPTLEGGKTPTPMHAAHVYFDNVRVDGGDEAMGVEVGATVTANNCRFAGSKKGILLNGGRVHFEKCAAVGMENASYVSPKCNVTMRNCDGLLFLAPGKDSIIGE